MKFSDLIPHDLIRDIAGLAKLDWFEADQDPDNPLGFRVRTPSKSLVGGRMFAGYDGRTLIYLNALCQLYKGGFKVFRPTAEQCESMEQIDLRIRVGDIKAPFPAFAIDLPPAYRESLLARCGACPNALFFQQGATASGIPYVVAGGPFYDPANLRSLSPAGGLAEYFYIMHENGEEVEAKLRRYLNADQTEIPLAELGDPGHRANEHLARLAINLALVATHFGVTRPAEANPKYAARLREMCGEHESARVELKTMAKYFELAQHTVVREVRPASEDRGGTHASPRPHWRRGHWRSAPGYARLRAEGKQVPLVFIRPTLVRAGAFAGEVSSTTAEYRLGKNSK